MACLCVIDGRTDGGRIVRLSSSVARHVAAAPSAADSCTSRVASGGRREPSCRAIRPSTRRTQPSSRPTPPTRGRRRPVPLLRRPAAAANLHLPAPAWNPNTDRRTFALLFPLSQQQQQQSRAVRAAPCPDICPPPGHLHLQENNHRGQGFALSYRVIVWGYVRLNTN